MSHNVTVKNVNISSLSVIDRAVKELQNKGAKVSISAAPGRFRGYADQMSPCERAITIQGSRYEIGVVKTKEGFTLSYDQSMCASSPEFMNSVGGGVGATGVDGKPIVGGYQNPTFAIGSLIQLCNVISAEDQAGIEGHLCSRSYDTKTKQYVLEIEEAA